MPNDYQGFSPVDFARSATTTLADHIMDVEEAFTRNFPSLAQMEAAGRITYNHEGRGFDWPVQYRIHNVEGNTGETQRNFARRNLWKTAQLEYRGYQVTDAMYMREFKENRGRAGIIKVYDNFIDRLDTSLRQVLGKEVYTDGSAAGNEKLWHGFESMFSQSGTIDVSSTGVTARANNAADKVGDPNDTYAALSTALANYGGEWDSNNWPDGDGDPEVDFWSPIICKTDSTAFGDVLESFRFAIIHCQKNATLQQQLTTGVLSRTLYETVLNLMDDKEEIQVGRGDLGEAGLVSLGFRNVFRYDGVEFTFDAALGGTVGYGYNYNNCELRSLDPQLLNPEGPEYDIHTQAFNAVVGTLSNKKFSSPRNFIKWMPNADFS